jgi:eukaryotic-like serine/threonine-protein kinase
VVGRFELLREIGRGGFGVVYEARDRQLGRLVAFKAIRPGARLRARLGEEWLLREAETAAQLSHPGIATLHDAGRSDHGPYLVFELLEGETLRERLARGPLPVREGLRIGIDIARALAYAHAAGVTHCDLKPSNVFLTDGGAVKVLDFGLARVFGETRVGSGGTPVYMAPEQWRGEKEDPRADVFALGAMVYEMVAGSRPFEVTSERSSALDPGPAPPLRVPGAPAKLVAFVAAALEKDPARRLRNGQAALEALLDAERALGDRGDWVVRKRRWGVAVVAFILSLFAVAAVLTARSRHAAPPERITVAVADFANETGEPELDGLSGLLITSLEQSRRLTVLTRSRMLDVVEQLGKARVERIDEPLAREVGRHVGARALMFATIRRFDALYAVEMKALDPVADAYLFTVQEQASGKASIPGAIDRLSERTRRALRESAEEVRASEVKVADAVTGSLEAYHHYFLGAQCEDEGLNPSTCARHFNRALEVDPTFALAQYRLAFVASFEGGAPASEQRAAFDAALRHVDRFPSKERLIMLAFKAHLEGDDSAALATYRRLAADYPQDKYIAYMMGEFHLHQLFDVRGAIPWFEKVVQLDPGHYFASFHLIDLLADLGREGEVVALATDLAARRPGATAWINVAYAYARAGQVSPALDWMQRAVDAGSDVAREYLAELRMFAGDYARAEAGFRQLLGVPGFEGAAYSGLAAISGHQGRRRDGLRILESVGRSLPEGRSHIFRVLYLMGDGDRGVAELRGDAARLRELSPRLYGYAAANLAYAGDLEAAAEIARHLAPRSFHDRIYRAVVAWRTGQASAAADRLGENVGTEPGPWISWFHAEALFDARRFAEAAEALKRFQDLFTMGASGLLLHRSWAYPKSLYLIARCHEELGEREKARAHIEKLLALWKDADPDLPLLGEARALRARLGKAEPARAP